MLILKNGITHATGNTHNDIESNDKLTEHLKAVATEKGASLVGFSDISSHQPLGHESLTSAITIAIRLSDAIMEQLIDAPTHAYFHQYRTANAFLDHIAFYVALELQKAGYRTLQIAASQTINANGWNYKGLFPHRTAAVLSGIGWIGKNNSLITPEFGPRVRLATVLTNANLVHSADLAESQCGSCTRCIEACPSKALTGNSWRKDGVREDLVDPKICSEFMHAKFQHIGRGVICGLCLSACPVGSARLNG